MITSMPHQFSAQGNGQEQMTQLEIQETFNKLGIDTAPQTPYKGANDFARTQITPFSWLKPGKSIVATNTSYAEAESH